MFNESSIGLVLTAFASNDVTEKKLPNSFLLKINKLQTCHEFEELEIQFFGSVEVEFSKDYLIKKMFINQQKREVTETKELKFSSSALRSFR